MPYTNQRILNLLKYTKQKPYSKSYTVFVTENKVWLKICKYMMDQYFYNNFELYEL